MFDIEKSNDCMDRCIDNCNKNERRKIINNEDINIKLL